MKKFKKKLKINQSLGPTIFSKTNAFSVTGKTREALVQKHADDVVDCSTDVNQQDRSPRLMWVLWMLHIATLDDQSWRWPVVVMSWQLSIKYCGEKPFGDL